MPKCDVAVLGAGIAGLSVAALLAGSGKKVVLTDPGDSAGGSIAGFVKDGFRFTAGPNAVYGLQPGGILHAFFSPLDETGLEPVRAARYQVVLPDRRITIAPGQQETLEELRREYPREIDRIAALYRDAQKLAQKSASSRISSYFAERRSAWKFLGRYRFSPELLTYFSVQSRYFFGKGLEELTLSSLVLMLCSAPASFPGGFDRLALRMASRIAKLNGPVLWNEPWPVLEVQRRKATGIKTSQGHFETKAVFINADQGSEQLVHLGIREEVIPVSMEPTVLCVSDYRRPEDYYSLEITPRGMNAPENMRTMTASFSVSGTGFAPQDELISRIAPLMPFLKDFTVTVAAPKMDTRQYAIAGALSPQIYPLNEAKKQSRRKTFKNVLLVPDSSRYLHGAIRDARLAASRLS